jgi:hypothetical protein
MSSIWHYKSLRTDAPNLKSQIEKWKIARLTGLYTVFSAKLHPEAVNNCLITGMIYVLIEPKMLGSNQWGQTRTSL